MPTDMDLIYEDGYVQIFNQPANHIFFRGLRVTDCKPTMFTYNLTGGVTLTEDRTSKFSYSDQIYIMKALQSITDPDKLDIIMDSEDESIYEADLPWDVDYGSQGSTYVARVSYRFHSGAHLPKRIKSFYESRVEEDAQEKFVDVKLTESMIERLTKVLKEADTEDIDKSIFLQLPDVEILF